jgi:hypothetical protein
MYMANANGNAHQMRNETESMDIITFIAMIVPISSEISRQIRAIRLLPVDNMAAVDVASVAHRVRGQGLLVCDVLRLAICAGA